MRKFHALQLVGAMALAEQLNKLEERGAGIFQVLYAIDLNEVGAIHNYTIIYHDKQEQDEVKGSA